MPFGHCSTAALSRALRAPDNRADEEYSLFARCKAPHNQRMEQMPSGHSSSARLAARGSGHLAQEDSDEYRG